MLTSPSVNSRGVKGAGRRPRHECGNLPFVIKRDGTWLYEGSPIARRELVCLFSSVLKREADGSYWLETPVERGRIEVEDTPWLAVEMNWCGEWQPAAAVVPDECGPGGDGRAGAPDRGEDGPGDRRARCRISVSGAGRARRRWRRGLAGPYIMSWSRCPCRASCAGGRCWGCGARTGSSPWATCRTARMWIATGPTATGRIAMGRIARTRWSLPPIAVRPKGFDGAIRAAAAPGLRYGAARSHCRPCHRR